MVILPIRNNVGLRRIPWVNILLILINVLVHVSTFGMGPFEWSRMIQDYGLNPDDLQLTQFITHQFLHGGFLHIFGNMMFLWVFGNALNVRLGHLQYALFYLFGGILAGVGFLLLQGQAPLVGASGAIAGVTGSYFLLYYRSEVLVFILILIYPLGTYWWSSKWLIGVYVCFDLYTMFMGSSGIGYTAHLTGYAFGVAAVLGLLKLKYLTLNEYAMMWEEESAGPESIITDPAGEPGGTTINFRSQILDRLERGDLDQALQTYRTALAERDQDLSLTPEWQIQIIKGFAGKEEYLMAARAMENLLNNSQNARTEQNYRYLQKLYRKTGAEKKAENIQRMLE